MELGIENPIRDTLYSSLKATEALLQMMGYSQERAERVTRTFLEHDEAYLRKQSAYRHDEKAMIQTVHEAAAELATLLRTDQENVSDDQSEASST